MSAQETATRLAEVFPPFPSAPDGSENHCGLLLLGLLCCAPLLHWLNAGGPGTIAPLVHPDSLAPNTGRVVGMVFFPLLIGWGSTCVTGLQEARVPALPCQVGIVAPGSPVSARRPPRECPITGLRVSSGTRAGSPCVPSTQRGLHGSGKALSRPPPEAHLCQNEVPGRHLRGNPWGGIFSGEICTCDSGN